MTAFQNITRRKVKAEEKLTERCGTILTSLP